MIIAVQLQITMVSINTPKACNNPAFAGCPTSAAAAAQETRAQREKRELKENLARMKTGMQEAAAEHDRERDGRAELLRQMDPKDQERILKEVLKEFLNS